jgi:large subunit ribosomal protein L23
MNKAYEVIRKPLVSEKNTMLTEQSNVYAFQVAMPASKVEIKQAIEHLFNVNVEHVRTVVVRGKNKRLGRNIGRRSNWKKAFVKLKSGDSIELFQGV